MPTRPLALVTGASSGIGAAFADLLASAGYDLVLVARRRDRLDHAAKRLRQAGAAVEVLTADLSETEGLASVIERIDAGDIRVLVSNAGVGGYARLAKVEPQEVQRLWTLNATAPMLLARAALPHLLAARSGGIITVASLLAFSGGQDAPYLPPRTLYAAAKAATVAFTRTLATELTDTGVGATVVCPGIVATEFSGGAAQANPTAMSAPDVAAASWTAFTSHEIICIPGLDDTTAVEHLAQTEAALMFGGNKPTLASRYN